MSKPIDAAALTAAKGKNDAQLYSTALLGTRWYNVYGKRTNVKSTLDFTRLKITAGLAPYQSKFRGNTNGSGLKYSGRKLTVTKWDRDIEIDASDFLETWMGEMQNGKYDLPFPAYTLKQYELALAAEFTEFGAYWGLGPDAYPAYNAGTAYTANSDSAGLMKLENANGDMEYWKCISTTTAGQTPTSHPAKWKLDNARAAVKGVNAILKEIIAEPNSEITPLALGAHTSSNAYSHALALYRSLPEQFKGMEMELQISVGLAEKIADELSTLNQYNIKSLDDLPAYLPKTNKKLKIEIMDNMIGSNRMIITTPGNNVHVGVNFEADMVSVKFVDTTKATQGTFWGTMGFVIRDPLALFCNELE